MNCLEIRAAHLPCGLVIVTWRRERLTKIEFASGITAERTDKMLTKQLLAVLGGAPVPPRLRPDFSGLTDFMRSVLVLCQQILPRTVMTYGELAEAMGKVGAARAVGIALARNPFPLVVPCHRVVGKYGRLVGYSGGLARKAALLKAEGWKIVKQGSVFKLAGMDSVGGCSYRPVRRFCFNV